MILKAQAIKDRYPLSDVVGSSVKLKRAGNEFTGLCPFHNEKSPSFTVNDYKQFYHCFGCGAHGSVIDWVMHQDNLSFKEAVSQLSGDFEIKAPLNYQKTKYKPETVEPTEAERIKFETALQTWNEAKPAAGTIVETYLNQSRQIDLPIPESIRFHSDCIASMGNDGIVYKRAPAMVAAIQDMDGKFRGLHRTFLQVDGKDKQLIGRDKPTAKKMLGTAIGFGVRLSPRKPVLHAAEGIESALSILEMAGGADKACVWALLSMNGLLRLLAPEWVKKVIWWADNEKPGARGAAEEMAVKASLENNIPIEVRPSPEGMDPNDWLIALKNGGV